MMWCLAFARALKENSINIEFICCINKGNLVDKIRLSGFDVHGIRVHDKDFEDIKLSHPHWLGQFRTKLLKIV